MQINLPRFRWICFWAILVVSALSMSPPVINPAKAQGIERYRVTFERFAREDTEHPSSVGTLVFVGSSTIRLWPDLASIFDRSSNPIITSPTIRQRGFGGGHLQDVVDAYDQLIAPHQPTAIILYAGENDIAAGASPHDVSESFLAFLDLLENDDKATTPVILIGIKPSPARWALWPIMEEANQLLKQAVDARSETTIYLPLENLLLDPSGMPVPSLYRQDQLHLSGEGYEVLEDALLDFLIPMLQ